MRIPYELATARSNASNFQWVEAASGIPTDVGLYSITVSAGCGGCVEFRLVQEEHGGGVCNCWNISGNVTVDESGLQTLGCSTARALLGASAGILEMVDRI